MCECVGKIEKDIKDRVKDDYKKPVKEVKLAGKILSFGDGKVKATSTFNVELEGQKKTETVKLVHAYCPFCGEKQ